MTTQLQLGGAWSTWGLQNKNPSLEELICNEYKITPEELNAYEVLIGAYWHESYEGTGWLLLRKKEDGKLYEVNASHCSCMGLEDQFGPKETTVTYLLSEHFPYRPGNTDHYYVGCSDEDPKLIREFIEKNLVTTG